MTLNVPLRRWLSSATQQLHDGLFGHISAVPFGLLRIGWAFAAFNSFFFLWPNLRLFYSDQGVFPPEWASSFARTSYRFTLLSYVHDPLAVEALFLIMLLALVCMCIGYRTRLATIVSFVLLLSFQEHSFAVFAGGDNVLRVTGLILVVAPGIQALSLDRLLSQEESWVQRHVRLPRLTMPIWPRLLFTWQMIVIYVAAAWNKLLDPMWREGSALVASMNQAEFARFGPEVGRWFAYISMPFTWGTVAWQICWVIFLIPLRVRRLLPQKLRGYRRWMLGIGFIFHALIFIFLDAGIFSVAMISMYLGVLDQDDYDAMAAWINRRAAWKGQIAVLYDGNCSFCRRTVLPLLLGDWLGRLNGIDFRDAAKRTLVAPDLQLEALDDALHIRLPDGRTAAGFDAIRLLCWHVPWLWLVAPLLYLPGIAPLGRRAYRTVAASRYCLLKAGKC